jgi:iron complex outermembrane receptor protein
VRNYRFITFTTPSFALLTLAPAAFAQTAVAPAATDKEPDQVIVTGTRVSDRTRLETLAPVDVLNESALRNQGTTELAEALSTVTPSLNFPRPAVTDGTDHVRPAALRGLAPDETLVLVNSKRRHTSALVNVNGSIGRGSAAVDLNAIPAAAIERVEVLRDGASAQYGSDAIAGVVNIRLREAREGGGTSVTFGKYDTQVDAARISYSAHDGQTTSASGWLGLPLGADGFATLSGEYRDRNPTGRGDLDPRLATQNPPEPLRVDSRYGDSDEHDKTVYLNAGLPLAGDWETYGWAGFQDRDGGSAATPRIRSNPNNDPTVYPNGFLPIITSNIKDVTAAWGVRGPLAGWQADASLVYGHNKFDYGVEHSINGTLVPNSPTSFAAGGMQYGQLVLNAGLTRGFDWGFAGPANFAVGAEARREDYKITPGEEASYVNGPRQGNQIVPGAQGFPGFKPENATSENRSALSLYGDLETQLTEKWLASVAVRGEHYSDFGSAVTGKLSARYDFTRSFALRGAISTGFRAPSLQQQFFTSTATNFINGSAFEVVTLPATSPTARALGARNLDAEKSRNFSLGTVVRVGALETTLDAYHIEIDDRIVLSENIGGTAEIAALLPREVGLARFFINGVDTKTNGVDLVTRYGWNFESAGKLDVTASANYNHTNVTRLPTTNVLSSLRAPPTLFGRVNTLIFEEATPKSKGILALDWSRHVGFGSIGVGTKAVRYGKIVDPGTAPNLDFHLGAKTLVDLELRSEVGEHFQGALGVDNLFDTYPDAAPANLDTNGLVAFSRYSPFGFNGRFVYGRVGWNW